MPVHVGLVGEVAQMQASLEAWLFVGLLIAPLLKLEFQSLSLDDSFVEPLSEELRPIEQSSVEDNNKRT